MRKVLLLFTLSALNIAAFGQVEFKHQIIGQINFSPFQFYLVDMIKGAWVIFSALKIGRLNRSCQVLF